jgi:hypothetical protein
MPFESKQQARKCFALRAKGKAKGWDCDEWSEHTNFKKLPKRKKKAESAGPAPTFIQKIAMAAAVVDQERHPEWFPRPNDRFPLMLRSLG